MFACKEWNGSIYFGHIIEDYLSSLRATLRLRLIHVCFVYIAAFDFVVGFI